LELNKHQSDSELLLKQEVSPRQRQQDHRKRKNVSISPVAEPKPFCRHFGKLPYSLNSYINQVPISIVQKADDFDLVVSEVRFSELLKRWASLKQLG